MKKETKKLIMTAVPLILGLLSLLAFAVYFWSANHAPYRYVNVILAGPPLSVIGLIVSIATRKSRKTYPALWTFGLLSCLLGFTVCALVLLLLAGILISALNGNWI